MKTIEERAREFVLAKALSKQNFEELLIDFGKEQDRITLHMAAENVMKMSFCDVVMEEQELIDSNKAVAVIMNTKAV